MYSTFIHALYFKQFYYSAHCGGIYLKDPDLCVREAFKPITVKKKKVGQT